MEDSDEASLHIGQYRVLYLIDWTAQTITVVDIDKHQEAYRRLRRR
ncbi:MAG: type II toxin-antitoxin system RelE/ParE family toxin [Chloroflexi bacterium]|nr:type II toxin-antitoxin system RelE/ParE family toxin [Chloroflexota bacterium]